MTPRLRTWVIGLVTLSAVCVSAALLAQPRTRAVYLRVFDTDGPLITDLQTSEIEISEAGEVREVVRAVRGGSPRRILLVVDSTDDGTRGLNSLRAGLSSFIDAVPEEDELALITTGRNMRVRIAPSLDRKKLKNAAAGLFSDGGGNVLLDSLVDVDARFLATAPDRAGIIVIVSSDGPENSNSTREAQFEALGQSLVTRNVMVHALILSSRSNVGTLPALIASSLTQSTGGYFQSIYTTTAVPDRLREIADEIVIDHQRMNSWYQVDFLTDTVGQGRLVVGLRRPNIRFDVSSTRPRER